MLSQYDHITYENLLIFWMKNIKNLSNLSQLYNLIVLILLNYYSYLLYSAYLYFLLRQLSMKLYSYFSTTLRKLY
jgi:hypothetical protein